MEKKELELIQRLMTDNEELRQLMSEHQEYERALDELARSPYPSEEQQVEKKRIQKLKLAGRDRIEKILSLHKG